MHLARALTVSPQLSRTPHSPGVGLVARSPVSRLAVGRSVVRSVYDFDAPGMSTLFSPPGGGAIDPAVVKTVQTFDAIVSLCGGPDATPATRLREVASGPVWAIDPRVRPETVMAGRHITDQWGDDLHHAGLDVGPVMPEVLIRLDDADREHGRNTWERSFQATSGRGGPRVLLHPGSGGKPKCWPIDRFEVLATALQDDVRQVAWMIGPVEVDWYGQEFVCRLARTAPVTYEDDLLKAASAIATADVFVGNDAGIAHLAAALGVPTVAIYGPTSPDVWHPVGPIVRVLHGGGPPDPFEGVGVPDVFRVVAELCAAP